LNLTETANNGAGYGSAHWDCLRKGILRSYGALLGMLAGAGYFIGLCFGEISPLSAAVLIFAIAVCLIVPALLLATTRGQARAPTILDHALIASQWSAIACAFVAPFAYHWLQGAAALLCLSGVAYAKGKLALAAEPADRRPTRQAVSCSITVAVVGLLGAFFGIVDIPSLGFLLPALILSLWLWLPGALRPPDGPSAGQSRPPILRARADTVRYHIRLGAAGIYSFLGAIFLLSSLLVAACTLQAVLPPDLPSPWLHCVFWYGRVLVYSGVWPTLFVILAGPFLLAGGIVLCKHEYNDFGPMAKADPK
jgi:hypothetical protein